jgi:ABC-type dipeptide/oligopeptide/nickel transport system permease component
MLRFIIKRFLHALVVLLLVTVMAFALPRLAPGSPARLLLPDEATPEQIALKEAELGLDKPIYVQFFKYVVGLFRGDMGMSSAYKLPVSQIIFGRFRYTVRLALCVVVFGCLIAIPLGIVAGVNRGKPVDFFAMFFALLGQAMSPMWIGVLLIFIFAVRLNWFPALGTGGLKYLVLPVITLGYPMAATLTRVARSGMIDTLSEDYITSTYAKGVSKLAVYTKYGFRNAMIPVVTMIGLDLGHYLGGSVVTETVFSYSGIGQLLTQSVTMRDYTMIQGLMLISAFMFTFVNLIVDIINSFIDPRLSLG